MPSDDIRNLWQSQEPGAAPLTLEELRKKGTDFRSTIVRRNRLEYLAIVLMVPFFGYFAWSSHLPLIRLGTGLLAAGLLLTAYQLNRRASASPALGEMDWQSCLDFHRAQLVRQRDALRSIWGWYLGPLLPGVVTVAIAISLPAFRKSLRAGLLSFTWIAVAAAVGWRAVWINRDAVDKLQKQIDDLE